MKSNLIACFLFWLLLASGCKEPETFPQSSLDERMSGGDATAFDAGSGAYGNPVPGLSARDEQVHAFGDKMFGTSFVQGPAPVFSGLGPVFNQNACSGCHISEGRGKAPSGGTRYESMFFKVSLPGSDPNGAPNAVPGFGLQIQDRAVFGTQPEAKVHLQWNTKTVLLAGGESVELRYPTYTIQDAYLPLPAGVLLSARVARPVVGMGLVEGIDEHSIIAHADPSDADGDGISGKPNYVHNYVTGEARTLGRMGWKASVADVKGQVARALNEDIGVTTSVFPHKNATGQSQMAAAYLAPGPDLHDSVLHAITFYMKTLSVPARRDVNEPDVLEGQRLFKSIGCVRCHADVYTTKVNVAFRPLSAQVIRPYSDFLLHDMGPELADNRPEFEASGQEWRTAPLWGVGLSRRVSGHTQLLHDGRARSFTEAILWHGGEAEKIKQTFSRLSSAQRSKLVRFLESL